MHSREEAEHSTQAEDEDYDVIDLVKLIKKTPNIPRRSKILRYSKRTNEIRKNKKNGVN